LATSYVALIQRTTAEVDCGKIFKSFEFACAERNHHATRDRGLVKP
jgi:hypothetical protein